MKNLKKGLFILITLCSIQFVTQGCKTVKNEIQNQPKVNIDGEWTLKEFEGKDVVGLSKGSKPTLNINSREGAISGNGGCNSFRGSFSIDNGILSAPNLITTMKLCSEENLEPEYLKMLSKPNKIRLADNLLILSNEGKTTAIFEKVKVGESIVGQWYLNTMPEEDLSILFLTSENIPTIDFNNDGMLGGKSGCNNYSASYEIENSQITIGPIMSTRMACPNLEGENKFITRLSGTNSFSIVNGELLLYKEGKIVLTFKRK